MRTVNQPAPYGSEDCHARERIKVLQAQAMTLLRAAFADPGSAALQQVLAAVDAEIIGLRSQLAWRRAGAHGNAHISAARSAVA
jgi:hypothetical protein